MTKPISNSNKLHYWLMKSEPDELSIDDLKRLKKHHWDGVRGYEARNSMRDQMRQGDMVLFYHSNSDPIGIAGVAKVASLPYPDFTQWDEKSKYFDLKATKEKPTWFMVDVKFVKRFAHFVSRAELKQSKKLESMKLWTHSRLSIFEVTENEFDEICKMGESKTSA